MPRLTRRQLLLQGACPAAGAAAALTAGHAILSPEICRYPASKATTAIPSPGVIRPPGALEEESFLAACIRCTRCQDACEPGAIQLFALSKGRHAHTPYIDPALAACTLCMKCTNVCPTIALTPMGVADRGRTDMASVELVDELCLSYKAKRLRAEQALLVAAGLAATDTSAAGERRGPCGECYTVCPARERAITLEPGGFLAPRIHPSKCLGCGLCEEICRAILRGRPAIRTIPKRRLA